jgi:hypothetical protein
MRTVWLRLAKGGFSSRFPAGLGTATIRAESGALWHRLAIAPAGKRLTAMLAGEGPLRTSLHANLGHDGGDGGLLFQPVFTGVRTDPQAFANERPFAAGAINQGTVALATVPARRGVAGVRPLR